MTDIDFIRLTSEDNVATATRPLDCGETITVGTTRVTIINRIPRWHKFAINDIGPGEKVFKFGMPIGIASQRIRAGEHVGSHNLKTAQKEEDVV
ncbi:MAG: UxaA family hydrolase [Firmicutes bacterium]|nr:UxaA family hydrolase [Bacillota bacterium]